MFFTLILENENGEQLDMTTTANQYMTSKIEGLSPPAGTINTSAYAGINGSYLNRAFLEKRNVVISYRMKGVDIESRRHALYRVVKPAHYIKVYYRTRKISVYTEGYVETNEVDNFTDTTTGQISVICPDIYWYSLSEQIAEYRNISGAFKFPFAIDSKGVPFGYYHRSWYLRLQNEGDEIGLTFIITGIGGAGKNTRNLSIYNAETGAYMRIRAPIEDGDILTITTHIGRKTCIMTRNGVQENWIGNLKLSEWLTARTGENTFYVNGVGVTNVSVKVILRTAYLGV